MSAESTSTPTHNNVTSDLARRVLMKPVTMRHLLVTMGILSSLFGGCKKKPASLPAIVPTPASKRLETAPEVTSETEDGFHDLVFFIQEHRSLSDGSQSLRATGTHKGRPVSVEVILGSTWKAGSLGNDIPVVTYRGTVTYRSTGAQSDAFLQVLDQLYGTNLNPKAMTGEVRFTAISLGGDPRDLTKEPVQIKLFYETGKDEDYAELFTNIDVAEHRLEIREKDEGYRLPLIKAMQPH